LKMLSKVDITAVDGIQWKREHIIIVTSLWNPSRDHHQRTHARRFRLFIYYFLFFLSFLRLRRWWCGPDELAQKSWPSPQNNSRRRRRGRLNRFSNRQETERISQLPSSSSSSYLNAFYLSARNVSPDNQNRREMIFWTVDIFCQKNKIKRLNLPSCV
jgi:hypothetical protein